jgi:conjugal transfer pilus assembly protein TrbC
MAIILAFLSGKREIVACFKGKTMNKLQLVMTLLFLASVGFANTNDELRAYQAQADTKRAQVTPQQLSALQSQSALNQAKNQALIDQLFSQAKASVAPRQEGQAADGALLFVSFSMPESLLFALADEAARFKIPLVIKGLVDGDFNKTIARFAQLHARAKKEKRSFPGLLIDPLWFEQFHISHVPALVLTHRPTSCEAQRLCAKQPFDVVYGNVSIRQGLQLLADKGEAVPQLAKHLLELGHV